MKRLLLFLCLVAFAKADVLRFTINSANFNDGSFYVGAYNSSFTNQQGDLFVPVESFCVDFEDHVNFGETFNVHPFNLADYHAPDQVEFWQAGWLALQIGTSTDVSYISNIQRAIWLITDPGSTSPYLNTPASLAWVAAAQANYLSIPASDITLYERDGMGQSQISVVPEPSTYAYVGVGILSLIGFRRLRK